MIHVRMSQALSHRIALFTIVWFMANSNDIWKSPSWSSDDNKVVELWLRNRVYFSTFSIANFGAYRVGYYSGFTAGFRREKIKASSPFLFPFLTIGLSNFPGKIWELGKRDVHHIRKYYSQIDCIYNNKCGVLFCVS